jgi:hypothetical protein
LAKRPSSSSLVRSRPEAGEARAAAARRPPGHYRGRREGGKGEDDEGILLPHSPWVEAARGEGSTAGGGPVVVVLGGGGALVLRQGKGGGCGEVRRPGKRPTPFIGGGRRFGRGFFELGKLRGSTMVGRRKYPAVDPVAAGIRSGAVVLCDWMCRAGAREGGMGDTAACPASSPLMAVAGSPGRARAGPPAGGSAGWCATGLARARGGGGRACCRPGRALAGQRR